MFSSSKDQEESLQATYLSSIGARLEQYTFYFHFSTGNSTLEKIISVSMSTKHYTP